MSDYVSERMLRDLLAEEAPGTDWIKAARRWMIHEPELWAVMRRCYSDGRISVLRYARSTGHRTVEPYVIEGECRVVENEQ